MTGGYRYDRQYREAAELKDGRQVVLRMVTPADKAKLVAGFAQLSSQSRYRRFFSHKNALTDRELRYFTETDGIDHFAIGASLLRADGSEGEGAGIARFIRVSREPAAAEIAITVVDELQGKGLGRILLERLIEAASERDVTLLRFHLLAENEQMRELLNRVCDKLSYRTEEGVMTGEIELPGLSSMPMPSVDGLDRVFEILRLVAGRALEPQLAAGRELLETAMSFWHHREPADPGEPTASARAGDRPPERRLGEPN
jgi:GNAT superfamily N-acetyltransferase